MSDQSFAYITLGKCPGLGLLSRGLSAPSKAQKTVEPLSAYSTASWGSSLNNMLVADEIC